MSGMSGDVLAVLQRLEAGLTKLGTRFGSLETRFESLETRFERLETRFESQEARLMKLEIGQKVLETGIRSLETGQGELSVSLLRVRTEVMDRIDRLQNEIAVHHDDSVVTYHMQERFERMARAAQEAALSSSEQVNRQQRQIQKLEAAVRALKGEL